ncbi:hypothetical protein LBMAG18_03920 [Alphaproteobacteria bacterium]|nr:hypothetical protein LBMAG18_03920 [Alphaproteobacteria bacterium]
MKNTSYSSAHIANYFLWRAWREEVQITPMKLIKLVYIAYGWNLVINQNKLFNEKILAWDYGPVIPSIFHEFKRFGKDPITKGNYATDGDCHSETGELLSVPIVSGDDNEVLKVLNAEWEIYKFKDGLELSKITHEEGSAWSIAYKQGAGKNSVLSDDDIKKRSSEAINRLIKKSKAPK